MSANLHTISSTDDGPRPPSLGYIPEHVASAILAYAKNRSEQMIADARAAMASDRLDEARDFLGQADGIQKLATAIGTAALHPPPHEAAP